MKVGDVIEIEKCELVVTQVRLDRTASGTTAMIQLADPILYMKEKIEMESRTEYVEKHKRMMDAVAKSVSGEGDKYK